ncbi:MAG: hypothetical protein QM570_05920 [Planctomycetota bacterium]|nr:hypothetical protein [Planctomycetota bacterium]
MLSRRDFLAISAAAGASAFLKPTSALAAQGARRFHCCLASKIITERPELLDLVREAGVSEIWLASYFFGHWYEKPEDLKPVIAMVEAKGLGWNIINVPLGHPGDALGDATGATPLTPPTRWRLAERPDGTKYSGTSLHPPATQENVDAIRRIRALKPGTIFLDDDFRLAQGPGVIGGCFCDWHKKQFLEKHGFSEVRWEELLADVNARNFSPILRNWVDHTCDQLTACFKAQQAAAPQVALGNMIMYFGAEKAGIRLADYADGPFRVGEMMFHDGDFGRLSGKTGELFSCLFHRRFARADLAYSETTAFPANQLSAKNMAAKLAVSTICDVRNTMYMSGMTPFPETHWETLAPAMRKQAAFHEAIQGHTPRGPFKHYWGQASRYVGNDNPFSIFLASGIPFEVVDTLSPNGWTFLSDQDARYCQPKGNCFCRTGLGDIPKPIRAIPDSLNALWRVKAEMVAGGLNVPYVTDDKPVVCAWYPTARKVFLWNLAETKEDIQLQVQDKKIPLSIGGLDSVLVSV